MPWQSAALRVPCHSSNDLQSLVASPQSVRMNLIRLPALQTAAGSFRPDDELKTLYQKVANDAPGARLGSVDRKA